MILGRKNQNFFLFQSIIDKILVKILFKAVVNPVNTFKKDYQVPKLMQIKKFSFVFNNFYQLGY